jgi:hypothetical protein
VPIACCSLRYGHGLLQERETKIPKLRSVFTLVTRSRRLWRLTWHVRSVSVSEAHTALCDAKAIGDATRYAAIIQALDNRRPLPPALPFPAWSSWPWARLASMWLVSELTPADTDDPKPGTVIAARIEADHLPHAISGGLHRCGPLPPAFRTGRPWRSTRLRFPFARPYP